MTGAFALEAVRLGLLKIAPPGESFVMRRGRTASYVIDSRGATRKPALRRLLVDLLVDRMASFCGVNIVAGIAKSGIIWAGWVAWEMRLGYVTVLIDGRRPSGLQREVEGEVDGGNVVLIDNWVRSGESMDCAARLLEKAGAKVLGAVTLACQQPIKLNIPMISLWQAAELEAAARELGLMSVTSQK